jgi:hypothetical protein
MGELEPVSTSFDRVGWEMRVEVQVSSNVMNNLTECFRKSRRKEREKSGHEGVTILALVGLACQLASTVIFIALVLVLTGMVNLVLAARAKEIGKGGESPNSRNMGRNASEASKNPPHIGRKRESYRNLEKRVKSSQQHEKGHSKSEDTELKMPAGPTSITSDVPNQQPVVIDLSQMLAVQCPLPGQPGAPSFAGKDISIFLRNWERFTAKYRFSPERKVTEFIAYCDPELGKYVETLIEIARQEADTSGQNQDDCHWKTFSRLALKKFRKDDTEQQLISIPFLQDLVKDKAFRKDADEVERYIYLFREVSSVLVKDQRLTGYEQVVLFLQGMPEGLVGKIYSQVKLDIDDPSTFVREGCFKEAIDVALTLNRTAADVNRLQALGIGARVEQQENLRVNEVVRKLIQNPERKPVIPAIVKISEPTPELLQAPKPNWEDRMGDLEKEMQELRIYRQQMQQGSLYIPTTQPNIQAMPFPSRPRYLGSQPYRPSTNQLPVGGSSGGGMNPRGCRWCGEEGHIKVRCSDYQKSLAEGVVHYLDHADMKTRMGPHGSGGTVVPLPEYSGVWQRAWVERERQKSESQMHQERHAEEVRQASGQSGVEQSAGKVRNLTLEEEAPMVPLIGTLTVGSSGVNLRPGEVRGYLAQKSARGEL